MNFRDLYPDPWLAFFVTVGAAMIAVTVAFLIFALVTVLGQMKRRKPLRLVGADRSGQGRVGMVPPQPPKTPGRVA